MSWNGAGVYSRGYASWSNDAANNLPISATKFDTEDNDFAGGINNCLTKDGQNSPTAALVWTIASGIALSLRRQSSGVVFSAGFNGGSNNPAVQISVADGTGATINLTTLQNLTFAIAGTAALTIGAAGTVLISAPSAGLAFGVNGFANSYTAQFLGDPTSGQSLGVRINAGTTTADAALVVQNQGATTTFFEINGIGNVAIAAPTAGVTLLVNGISNTQGFQYVGDGVTVAIQTASTPQGIIGTTSNHPLNISTNNSGRITIAAAGNVTVNTPTSGVGLTVNGLANQNNTNFVSPNTSSQSFGPQINAGTNSSDRAFIVQNAAGTNLWQVYGDGSLASGAQTAAGPGSINASAFLIGGVNLYAGVPVNTQNATYAVVAADNGKTIYKSGGAAHVDTIPAGLPVGFTVTFIVLHGASSLTITNSDNSGGFFWAPSGTNSASRTLAADGVATCTKVAAGTWYISGSGIS